MSPSQMTKIRRQLRQIGNQLSSKLDSGISEYMKNYHSDPIVDIIDHLPKEELAAMAEALVNLTSLKRHVTRQARLLAARSMSQSSPLATVLYGSNGNIISNKS